MSKKVQVKNLKKISIIILVVIGSIILLGLISGLVKELTYDSGSSNNENTSYNNNAISIENEINKLDIVLANEKQSYLDCIKTSDFIEIQNLIKQIYATTNITFESHSPAVLTEIIESEADRICEGTINAYEDNLSKHYGLRLQLSELKNILPKDASTDKMIIFKLEGEASKRGNALITVQQVLKMIN